MSQGQVWHDALSSSQTGRDQSEATWLTRGRMCSSSSQHATVHMEQGLGARLRVEPGLRSWLS